MISARFGKTRTHAPENVSKKDGTLLDMSVAQNKDPKQTLIGHRPIKGEPVE